MKTTLRLFSIFCAFFVLKMVGTVSAQETSGYFEIKGDIDKFYIVTFKDAGWFENRATELEIGKAHQHEGGIYWSGAVIAKFRYHVDNWANGVSFIDTDIRQFTDAPTKSLFVGGWSDVTIDNSSTSIVIWLRGNTPYHYKANFNVEPVVHDGIAAAVEYNPGGATTYTLKTTIDTKVNPNGMTYNHSAYFNGVGSNYYEGSVGIGTRQPGEYKLAVAGTIGARRVKVTQETWADYVFKPDYKLLPLQDVKKYIEEHKHLPDVPSETEVAKKGLDLGEMNKVLLQKIEELTLHIISQQEEIARLKERMQAVEAGGKVETH